MRAAVAAVLLVAIVSACAEQIGDHWVYNKTATKVVILEVIDGREQELLRVGPGSRVPLVALPGGQCSTIVLIARFEAGSEIARRSEPFCAGDEWVIADAESPSDVQAKPMRS
jgi:hypothetical protein